MSDQDGLIALINTKQPKGNYLQIDASDLIQLPGDVHTMGGSFNGATSAEMSYLEGVTSYIQDQLNTKQVQGDYATHTDLGNYLPTTPSHSQQTPL